MSSEEVPSSAVRVESPTMAERNNQRSFPPPQLPEALSDAVASPAVEASAQLSRLLDLFRHNERDLLSFFLVELLEMLMAGGEQVVPMLEFSAQGALRNIPQDSDAVWAYLRLSDVALCHGFIEREDERRRLERTFSEIRSWTLGLANGVGRPKNGARRWTDVADYAQKICDRFPGLGSRTTIELS